MIGVADVLCNLGLRNLFKGLTGPILLILHGRNAYFIEPILQETK